jgi:hypothetical protein
LLDINSPEFAKQLAAYIDSRVERKLREVLGKTKNWATGKVAVSGSGATISVYINNSTTAVDVKNPRSLSLTAGQLVAVIYPNWKQDNMAYIDRVL